jgi:hypothetical protein
MDEKITPAEKIELFRATAESEEARGAFAESWAEVIDVVLPVETSVRSIFQVETLAPGAVPVYTSDVQPISAWYLPKFGQHPINIIEVEEVSVGTFELTSDVSYKIRDAKHGRIDIANRSLYRLADAMALMEETCGWDVLKAAVTTGNTVTGATSGGFTKALVDSAFEVMEGRRDHVVTDIYVSPAAMADIRGWTTTTIDPITQREIFVNAGMTSIYGAQIHVVYFLEDTEMYCLDTRSVPDPLGFMPIRDELKTFDDPTAIKNFRVGVIAYEEIGFVVMDGNRIIKVELV